MKRIGTVVRILEDGTADIVFARPSACGQNCTSCGACGANPLHTIRMTVSFPVQPGDKVSAETSGRSLLGSLFLCLTLPLLLFFAVWLLMTLLHRPHPALWGGGMAVLSLLGAIVYARKHPVYTQVAPVSGEG